MATVCHADNLTNIELIYMIEIFPIKEIEGELIVSARDLHKFLEVKDHFAQWCGRMFEYGFTECVDYQALHIFVQHPNGFGGTNKTDYALTVDCAKEIAMVQRTAKGHDVRSYYIALEKKLLALPINADEDDGEISSSTSQLLERLAAKFKTV